MITKQQANVIESNINVINHFLGERTSYHPDELKREGICLVSNEDRSKLELFNFVNDKPQKYFAYLSKDENGKWIVSNWMGEKLASANVYNIATSNFGDQRHYFDTYNSINGIRYYGIGYGGNGMYCRMKAFKNQ